MRKDSIERSINMSFIRSITSDNLSEVYGHAYNRFLYDNSSSIDIDGKTLDEKIHELFPSKSEKVKSWPEWYKKYLITLSDEKGNPLFEKIITNDKTESGFDIVESDFIHKEIRKFSPINLATLNFNEKKQIESYLDYLRDRTMDLQSNKKNKIQKIFNEVVDFCKGLNAIVKTFIYVGTIGLFVLLNWDSITSIVKSILQTMNIGYQ